MPMPAWFRRRWNKWLENRIPRVKSVKLTQRNTFIFPAKEGIVFLVIVLLIFIGGVNYENSLLLGTAFLLVSVFVVAIVSTYLNLSGLEIAVERAEPAHVGELAFLIVNVRGTKPARYGLTFALDHFRETFNLALDQSRVIAIPFPGLRRGKVYPARILVESQYPLGLIRGWTWISLDEYAVIYPKPLKCDLIAQGDGYPDARHLVRNRQQEEFAGLREYRSGDPLKNIHWKQLAKSGQLVTRMLEGTTSSTMVLSLDSVPGPGLEQRLSQLTWWAENCHERQIPFMLALPAVKIPAATGMSHLNQVRTALALFGQER